MKFIIQVLLTIFSCRLYGQSADNTDLHNDRNIYYQALVHYLNFRATDKFYSKEKKIDTILIYADNKTSDSLLDKIGTTKIIMVKDPFDYIRKRNWEGITLYSIFPLEYSTIGFSVSFVPFFVTATKKNKGLMFSNPGSYRIIFKFENNQFVFVRLEDHGI
jgi:hypothetical protein